MIPRRWMHFSVNKNFEALAVMLYRLVPWLLLPFLEHGPKHNANRNDRLNILFLVAVACLKVCLDGYVDRIVRLGSDEDEKCLSFLYIVFTCLHIFFPHFYSCTNSSFTLGRAPVTPLLIICKMYFSCFHVGYLVL